MRASIEPTTQEPCEREHLKCYLVQSIIFTVDDNGVAAGYLDSLEYDLSDVDEYYCSHCGDYWQVEKRYSDASRAFAWQAALDHLKPSPVVAVQEAA